MPEQPGPTTRTAAPTNGAGFLYSLEWMSSPPNSSRPGHSGMNGWFSKPVAAITWGDRSSSAEVVRSQPPSSRSMRSTLVPPWKSTSRAWPATCSTSSSRVGNIGVPFG